MSALSPHVIEEIKALPARYPQPRSAVMPALDLAQEELGYLTPEAMTEVATALQLDAGYVEGVATFYSLFHLEPIGKHRFYMCTNLSCTLRGAEEMVEHLRGAIGVKGAGEVSQDGLFSYEEVECMGACEYAPMCRIDHRYHYDLTAEKLDGLISERRAGQTSHLPTGGEVARSAGGRGGQVSHLPAGGEVARSAGGETEPVRAPKKPRSLSPTPVQAAPPHPPAAPATSPASGEVGEPRPPAPATSPASGEVGEPRPPAPATSPASGEVTRPKPPRKKKADG